jgi:hypothetical protein
MRNEKPGTRPEGVGTERLVSSKLWRRRKRSEREETGNPLAGLSGLSRRSFGEDGSEASAKKCEMKRRKKSPHRPNHTKADGVKRKGREHYGSDMLIFMFMQTKCQHNRETRILFPVCSCISVEKNPPLTRHKNNQWVLRRLSGTL